MSLTRYVGPIPGSPFSIARLATRSLRRPIGHGRPSTSRCARSIGSSLSLGQGRRTAAWLSATSATRERRLAAFCSAHQRKSKSLGRDQRDCVSSGCEIERPICASYSAPSGPTRTTSGERTLAEIKAPYPDLRVVLEFLGKRRVSKRQRNRVNRSRHVRIVVPIVTRRWSWRPSSLLL